MTLSVCLSLGPLPLTIRHYRVTLETCDLWDIWLEWWRDMTWLKNSTYPPTYLSTYLRAHPQGAILETCDLYDICSEWWGDLTWPKKTLQCCDIWDTDNYTDNWEPEFMTIFVTWQLIATLDSIRNSCDVFCFWECHQLRTQFIFLTSFCFTMFNAHFSWKQYFLHSCINRVSMCQSIFNRTVKKVSKYFS